MHQHRQKINNTKNMHISCCVSLPFVWWQQTIFCHNCCTQKTYHWIFEVTQHYVWWVQYTIWKHIWLCWEQQKSHCIITDVNVVTGLFCYYMPWWTFIKAWQRSRRWTQLHGQKVYFPININCATTGCKRLWQTYGYEHCNL